MLLVTERRSCSTAGPEGYGPKRLAPAFVVAGAVVLEQRAPAARHQERMQARHTAITLHLRETGAKVPVGGHGPISA